MVEKKISLFVISAVFCLSIFTGSSLFAEDKIVAVVNKDAITQKDLGDFFNFMRLQLSAEYRGRELEAKIQSMKPDMLNKLIEDRLILQEAKKNNIAIDPARIKGRINEIRRSYGSDSEFQSSLAKQGMVQADLEAKIREQLLMYAIIEKEVRSKIIVKPVEVTDFYRENSREFTLPEQRVFRSVAVNNPSLADEIYDKLKKGEDFQGIANAYSLSVNKFTSVKNGELRKDIENIVFRMNLTDIPPPVKIQENYYIIKLDKIIPPRQQSLPEMQDQIYVMLFNKKMEEALARWIDDLKANSYIKILQS